MNDRKLLFIVSSITITLVAFITLSIYFKLHKRESITFKNISGFREVNGKVQKVSCQNMKIKTTVTNDSILFDLNGVVRLGYKIIQHNTPSVIYAEDKYTVIKFIYEKKQNQTLLFFKPNNQLIIALSSSQLNCN